MALRGITISIISSQLHFSTLSKTRVSAPVRVLPLQLVRRSYSTSQANIQGIRSQAMADTSSTVPSVAVFVTVPNKEHGRKLARSIIEAKLAGCVNHVAGIESTYWWQDKVLLSIPFSCLDQLPAAVFGHAICKIETDSEEMLIIKTRQSLVEALTAHVKANHPYEVCEVIALPIMGGNNDYLKWLKESTRE